MKNVSTIVAIAIAFFCCAISALALTVFKTVEVSSAGDVQFPAGSIASGVVVVDISTNSKGEVTGTEVQRDITSLTCVAKAAAESWKCRPAQLDGAPTASRLRVAFVFRPRAIMVTPPVFAPLRQPEDAARNSEPAYTPPGILKAVYPAYPIDAATVGTVVVQFGVDEDGKVGDLKLLRAYNPFNQFCLEAAREWQFQAATFGGQPIASNVVIAFVFSPPITTN
jgi:TonB family protein